MLKTILNVLFVSVFSVSLFSMECSLSSRPEKSPDYKLKISKAKKQIKNSPRNLSGAKLFNHLVDRVYKEIVLERKSPGLVVGLSGTDSIVAFLAAVKAFEKIGLANRVVGIHYGKKLPESFEHESEKFPYWFQTEIIPWLKEQAPKSEIIVNSEVDSTKDGLRWGSLLDWSVIEDPATGSMRAPENQYWVVGTHNRTERELMTYSNMSMAASIQFMTDIWKTEILDISRFLGVPKIAIEKSTQVDCACGRLDLPAANIPEVDAILMVRSGELRRAYLDKIMDPAKKQSLINYVEEQIAKTSFKKDIPYETKYPISFSETEQRDRDIQNIVLSAKKSSFEAKALSPFMPYLVNEAGAGFLVELFSQSTKASLSKWQAEAMALLGANGLRNGQRDYLLEKLFSVKDLSLLESQMFAKVAWKIAQHAFSFPQWRFTVQRINGEKSMAENFGMKPIVRENDVFNPELAMSDPGRDLYGKAVSYENENMYIEYRRAYLIIASLDPKKAFTLVIRNSSNFFGRDKLKHVAYYSNQIFSKEQLQKLDRNRLLKDPKFMTLEALVKSSTTERKSHLKLLVHALNALAKFNQDFGDFLLSEGNFSSLKAMVQGINERQNSRAAFYLGVVKADAASWSPMTSFPMLSDINFSSIEKIKQNYPIEDGWKYVLMSSELGDLP